MAIFTPRLLRPSLFDDESAAKHARETGSEIPFLEEERTHTGGLVRACGNVQHPKAHTHTSAGQKHNKDFK
jgi:hypothetical protein